MLRQMVPPEALAERTLAWTDEERATLARWLHERRPAEVGDVVVPVGAVSLGQRVPEVPHLVVGCGVANPSKAVLVRAVVFDQLVAAAREVPPAQSMNPYVEFVAWDRLRAASRFDRDPATRFRLGGVSVHEVVGCRPTCAPTRGGVLPTLWPTSDPVDCRSCLRVLVGALTAAVSA